MSKIQDNLDKFINVVKDRGIGYFNIVEVKNSTHSSTAYKAINHQGEKMAYAGGAGYDKVDSILNEILQATGDPDKFNIMEVGYFIYEMTYEPI